MSSEQPKPKTNIWDFLTASFVAAINKGQLPVLLIGLAMLVFVLKSNASELTDLLYKVCNRMCDWYILGWLLWITTVLLGFVAYKYLALTHQKELARIGAEKKRLQSQMSNKKLKSSEQ